MMIRVPVRFRLISGDTAFFFLSLAAFMSPFQVFSLDPAADEAFGRVGGGLNFAAVDFCLVVAFAALMFSGRRFRIPTLLPFGLYGVFLLLSVLSTIRAENVIESYFHVFQYLFIFGAILVTASVVLNTEEKCVYFYNSLLAGSLLHILISTYLYMTVGRYNPITQQIDVNDQFYGVGGLTRTGIIMVGASLVMVKMNFARGHWLGLLVAAALIVGAVAITITTFSRATLISMAIIFLVVAVLPATGRVGFWRVSRRLLLAFSVLVASIALGGEIFLPEHFFEKLLPVITNPFESDFRYRMETILAVFRSFPESAFLGYGMDYHNVVPGISPYFRGPVSNPNPHNVYLLWWAGSGFVAMVVVTLAYLVPIFHGVRAAGRSDSASDVRGILIATIAITLGFSGFYMVHGSIFRRIDWMVIAALFASANIVRVQTYDRLNAAFHRRPLHRRVGRAEA